MSTATALTALPAYEFHQQNWSDIIDHLPLLRSSAKGNALEIGVRGGVSTSALLLGVQENGGHLWSADINPCGQVFAEHPGWTFIQADSINEKKKILDAIPKQLDVLFVDGDHSYEGCKSDLETFGPLAKLILVHDCECPTTFPGVRQAFDEYAARFAKQSMVLPLSYGMGVIEMLDIRRARLIDGWMTDAELTWLARKAAEHHSIVEVGSYQGRSTRALGDNNDGVVYAVDDWQGLRENWWQIDTPQQIKDSLFERFTANVGDLIAAGKVKVIKADHAMLKSADLPAADLIFIDGDHTYESVKRDIETWLPNLSTGGIMCGHDYDQTAVIKAVQSVLGEVTNPVGLIWAWEKK